VRRSRGTPPRAYDPIEHPGWNLQPSIRYLTRKAATEDRCVILVDDFVNEDLLPGPRMPWIKKLAPITSNVGVPSSSCITADGRIRALTGERQMKPTSTRPRQSWRWHNRGGNPLNDGQSAVQTNRATSQAPSDAVRHAYGQAARYAAAWQSVRNPESGMPNGARMFSRQGSQRTQCHRHITMSFQLHERFLM
jgi:hypothetical protein